MQEIWKDVKDYEGYYKVSNKGSVISCEKWVKTKGNGLKKLSEKPKVAYPDSRGYLVTTLSKQGKVKLKTIHQLVAAAFIDNFEYGTEINHIDGNPLNPDIANLEISNPSHNQFHAVRTGLKKHTAKSKFRHVHYVSNKRAVKKWAVSIAHNGKSSYGWKTFMSEIDAAIYADELLDSINDTARVRNFPKP